ncbi:MAG: hypothetical protein WDA42_07485 [Candidatus Bathyarchaeia archaeon]
MAVLCANDFDGIGEVCEQSPLVTIVQSLFFTTPSFSFESHADFADEDKWKAAIAAGNILPVHKVLEQEGQDVEDSIYESTSGSKVKNFEGRRGAMYRVLLPLEQHKILRTYDQKNLKVFFLDMNNRILGTSPDGTKVTGFGLSYLNVSKQSRPTPESPAFTDITIQEQDVNEWDSNGRYLKPTWLGTALKGVLKVDVTPSKVATNEFTAVVQYSDNSSLASTGSARTAPVSGLEAGNFRIINSTGDVLDPEANPTPEYTVVESTDTPGTYTVSATTLVSGSVQIVASADNLYKSEVETLTSA